MSTSSIKTATLFGKKEMIGRNETDTNITVKERSLHCITERYVENQQNPLIKELTDFLLNLLQPEHGLSPPLEKSQVF